MNIQINLKLLIEKNLTPNEYVYLLLSIKEKKCNFEVDLSKLERLKYLKIVGDKIVLRAYNIRQLITQQEFNTEVENKDKEQLATEFGEAWEELLNLYPKKEGQRQLHNKVVALPKFKLALKQDGIETILKGLNNQLEARKKAARTNEFFSGMQNLSTWLHQKTYLTWLDYKDDSKPNERFTKA